MSDKPDLDSMTPAYSEAILAIARISPDAFMALLWAVGVMISGGLTDADRAMAMAMIEDSLARNLERRDAADDRKRAVS